MDMNKPSCFWNLIEAIGFSSRGITVLSWVGSSPSRGDVGSWLTEGAGVGAGAGAGDEEEKEFDSAPDWDVSGGATPLGLFGVVLSSGMT